MTFLKSRSLELDLSFNARRKGPRKSETKLLKKLALFK